MNEAGADNKFDAKSFLKTLPDAPGVYRMHDSEGKVIYVGKARSLKKRVASYFQKNITHPKTRTMVAHIAHIEVTVTHTENEALLLENIQIKSLMPRYNVLFRDDKSYPYIFLSNKDDFPRLSLHRGAFRAKGRYFGPYPGAGSVRETLSLLQKLFPVRQCEDSFYRNRSRPCLQYQIKRCTAPCTGLITAEAYAEDVRHAEMFLEGKSTAVIDELVTKMEQASEKLDFELAVRYRDQIITMRRIQEKQYIEGEKGDLDVIAVARQGDVACVQLFTIRNGRHLGHRSFYPKNAAQQDENTLLEAFITQFYLSTAQQSKHDIPEEILLNAELDDIELLSGVLSEQRGHKVTLRHKVRGDRSRWLKMAVHNAQQALTSRLNTQATLTQRYEALQDVLELDECPTRMECFDISHTMGEAPVGSCVVFDQNGPLKSDYRRFNIEDVTPGDDYAAMHQALLRRYKRLKSGEARLPDILFIDGGKGQVTQAYKVMEELQIEEVLIIGVAKGPSRKAGLETLVLSNNQTTSILPHDSPALHLIQQIRDEAHRFAITGHRQRRGKARTTSPLEDIPGLGPKRRQQLLKQFGGLQEVARAGVEDLCRVQGISQNLAQMIYDRFHTDGVVITK